MFDRRLAELFHPSYTIHQRSRFRGKLHARRSGAFAQHHQQMNLAGRHSKGRHALSQVVLVQEFIGPCPPLSVLLSDRRPTKEMQSLSVATCRTTQSDDELWVVTIGTAGKENSVSKLTWALEPRARWPSFLHQRQMLVSVPVARRPPGSRNLLLKHSAKPSGPRPRPRSFKGRSKLDLVPSHRRCTYHSVTVSLRDLTSY